MTIKYRQLDANGDYTIGLPFLTDSPAAVAQLILTRLRLFAGEWFLDTTAGTPYEEVLGKRSGKQPEGVIRERILETFGVIGITSLDSEFDADSRKLTVTAAVTTQFGAVAFNETL